MGHHLAAASFRSGQEVMVDRQTIATFVRELGEGRAIIQVGADTRVVTIVSLAATS